MTAVIALTHRLVLATFHVDALSRDSAVGSNGSTLVGHMPRNSTVPRRTRH